MLAVTAMETMPLVPLPDGPHDSPADESRRIVAALLNAIEERRERVTARNALMADLDEMKHLITVDPGDLPIHAVSEAVAEVSSWVTAAIADEEAFDEALASTGFDDATVIDILRAMNFEDNDDDVEIEPEEEKQQEQVEKPPEKPHRIVVYEGEEIDIDEDLSTPRPEIELQAERAARKAAGAAARRKRKEDAVASLQQAVGGAALPATVEDYISVRRQLDQECQANGVSLARDLKALRTRHEYLSMLETVDQWLTATRAATGIRQPLYRAERVVVESYIEVEKRWAEDSSNVAADQTTFLGKVEALKKLHNHGQRAVAGTVAAEFRFTTCRMYVASRAAQLRKVDMTGFSQEQVRQAERAAREVLDTVDRIAYPFEIREVGSTDRTPVKTRFTPSELEDYEWDLRDHGVDPTSSDTVPPPMPSSSAATQPPILDNFDPDVTCGFEELEDFISRISDVAIRIAGAADIVATINTLTALLDRLETAVERNPMIAESIGEESVATIQRLLRTTREWLFEHHDPSLEAVQALLRTVREVAFEEGLSQVETLEELTVNVNQPILDDAADGTGEYGGKVTPVPDGTGDMGRPRSARNLDVNLDSPPTSPTVHDAPVAVLFMDAVCMMVEELQLLRVACSTQLGELKSSDPEQQNIRNFASTKIRPLLKEMTVVVEDSAGYGDTNSVGGGGLQSPIGRGRAATSPGALIALAMYRERFRETLDCAKAEVPKLRIPASCWARLAAVDSAMEGTSAAV